MITNQISEALLLLSVDPKLKGLLIAAGPGLGKSALVRAYRRLLPEPYIELPLNVTEDRLLGGLDFERTLATGRRHAARGLLAAAHGGTLYVDEINLLDTSIANQIAGALSAGEIRLEREGLSASHPTDFLLIGTYDPAEGELRASLLDRIGLFVAPTAPRSPDARAEIIERALHASDEDAFEIAMLKGLIAEARSGLSSVKVSRDDRRRLSLAALKLGVEGNRADIFVARAARAHAALQGRALVAEEDIEAAVRFVLLPRATDLPPIDESEQEPRCDDLNSSEPQQDYNTESARVEDLIIKALDSSLPEELLEPLQRRQRRSATGSRGETLNRTRGRHVKSVPGKPSEGKIALAATLRAAAMQQTPRSRNERTGRVVKIKVKDLRIKRFRQKAGMLFIFAVDASGSMALHRMNQAKGALTRLLQQAYIHRDKVALISFRGSRAEVMLPPSQSVERAKRALDALPVGGATPIARGLIAALDLARRAHRSGIRQVMLLLFTDGRANVGLHTNEIADRATRQQAIQRELAQVGAALQYEGVTSVVVDTQSHFTSSGAGQALADLLGGRYVYLPRADAAAVCSAVNTIVER